MTTARLLTEEQLVQQAADLLLAKLGLVETTRFFALVSKGRIESVERHRAWQEALDPDEFFDEVFSASRNPGPRGRPI